MMIRIGLWIAACALLSVSAATVSAQATSRRPPPRYWALAMNPPSIPTPAMQDYVNAALRAHNAGVDGNEFTVKWSELEPAAGQLKVDDFVGGMNDYLNFFHDTALVGLQVLNTTAKETPSDLINVPFDDPRMLDRFKALIDAMLAQATHPITYLRSATRSMSIWQITRRSGQPTRPSTRARRPMCIRSRRRSRSASP